MKEEEMVSLANLGRGAAIEQFDEEFMRVIENILDPNTAAVAEREITVKVKLKPNEKRDFCTVGVSCTSKTQPAKAFATQLFIGRTARGVMATEYNPQQPSMFRNPAEKIAAGLKGEGGSKQ
jgi:hypothetical protein